MFIFDYNLRTTAIEYVNTLVMTQVNTVVILVPHLFCNVEINMKGCVNY